MLLSFLEWASSALAGVPLKIAAAIATDGIIHELRCKIFRPCDDGMQLNAGLNAPVYDSLVKTCTTGFWGVYFTPEDFSF